VIPRAAGARELLDQPLDPSARAASLADIDRLSAWFGAHALTLAAVRAAAAAVPSDRALTVIDVGGGDGAFARRLVRWARRTGRRAQVVVVERDPATLDLAPAHEGVVLVRADATALPFRDGAAHAATAGLTLHHLEPDGAVACLREMARVGGHVIVNDLLRTPLTLGLVWLATRLLGCHRVSRHDGPLSVRRAYAPDELRALAARAGLSAIEIRVHRLLGRILAVTR
jgi:ubiquinone/menaquinone biosynthesis C-methylase UbiE